MDMYLREYYVQRIHLILGRRLGDRLAEAQEDSPEEPVGQVNLHDHVYEIQNLAERQAVCPRSI